MRTFLAFILSLAALHAAEYPMASNIVARPLLQVSNAVESFAAYTLTNASTFGDWGSILNSGRSYFTNRFSEVGVRFHYICCAFGPPSFYIQATSLSSHRTRFEICAHPVNVKFDAASALSERKVRAANRIMTNIILNLEKQL